MERSIDFHVIRIEYNRIKTKIEAFESILLLKNSIILPLKFITILDESKIKSIAPKSRT